MERDPRGAATICAGVGNFNSRAHVERDLDVFPKSQQTDRISTHALTWSATRKALWIVKRIQISTHALTWSATFAQRPAPLALPISTHALTWSATILQQRQRRYDEFQLTRSRGARPSSTFSFSSSPNFNSRAHVERDPRCCCSWTLAPHDTDPILFGLQNIGAMFINR